MREDEGKRGRSLANKEGQGPNEGGRGRTRANEGR